ncbi:TPA: hypothetical protein ACGO1T_001868 [Streptococcus suis]
MAIKKNKHSILVAIKDNRKLYLSKRDEERGLDIVLNMQGWQIVAL